MSRKRVRCNILPKSKGKCLKKSKDNEEAVEINDPTLAFGLYLFDKKGN